MRIMGKTEWLVFSGGPSSGKTTIARELEKENYTLRPDIVREYIEAGLADGKTISQIRKTPAEFYAIALDLFEQSESSLDPNDRIILDGGYLDVLAYASLYFDAVPPWMMERVERNRCDYRRVFVFEPLNVFEQDAVRVEGSEETRRVFASAQEVYARMGYEPIVVSRFAPDREESIQRRLEFIRGLI